MRLGSRFAIWDRCNCGWDMCNERVFVEIITKPFQWRWFMDCGEWFCYFHLGKKWWRFSSAGFLSHKEYK